MTFDELLDQIAEDYLKPVTLPDGKKDCDRNGHTRITELQVRYGLSSLKIQKLLVTAGVYEPVKTDSRYYAVKRLYESGKSVEEIMEETGLSKATVNACIPYERGAKELDKLGVKITGDATRKRRQKTKENEKMENSRSRLAMDFTDASLWYALGEHDRVVFTTADGQRFHINAIHTVEGHGNGKPDIGDVLFITPVDAKGNMGEPISIEKAIVLDAFHKALDMKAEGTRVTAEELGEHGRYILPLLVFLGVLDGDRSLYTTKRKVEDDSICSCCGRKAERLFRVSSFEDLCELDRMFDRERESNWSEHERQMAAIFEAAGVTSPADEVEQRTKECQTKAAGSQAVQAFNADGERKLCEMCSRRIYRALLCGDTPLVSAPGDFDSLPKEMALDYVLKSASQADTSYTNIFGGVISPEKFDNKSMFLFMAVDREGVEHSFALTASAMPHKDGDTGISYRAMEVHKLTKAGKVASSNAWTDYDISHYKVSHAEDDFQQRILVGLLELEEKIRAVLMSSSLEASDSDASNLVTINGTHYSIGRKGQIIPAPVGYDERFQYMSLKGREWPGDEYGFMIDGILFSGEELAMLCSGNEGAQIRFSCEDPSAEPLRNDEYLMPVRLSEKSLVNETVDLINMFTTNGKFEREKDRENFRRLFTGVLQKLKIYHDSYGYGYGKLAGMAMVKQLEWIDGTETEVERVREIIRD